LNEEGPILTAVVTGLGGCGKCDNEENASKCYEKVKLDSNSLSYAAPELFLSVKRFPPTVNVVKCVKGTDVFAFSAILAKLLKSINEWY
jgi:hypothetical protein